MNPLLAILYLAIACGIAGALARNRTPLPLLASVALCLLFEWREVPFFWPLWVTIDLAVAAAIWRLNRGHIKPADWLVLSLFVPGFVGYAMDEAARFQVGFGVVVTQLLLTFPLAAVRAHLADRPREPDRWNEFDLMAVPA